MAELRPIEPDQIRCGACLQGYVPRDGVVHVMRAAFDDPGTPICPECLGRLASRGMIHPDDSKFKCHCDSLDPSKGPCPIHVSAIASKLKM